MAAAGCSIQGNAGNMGASSYVNSVCSHARMHQETSLTFENIALRSNSALSIEEFYDGCTHLNEEAGRRRSV